MAEKAIVNSIMRYLKTLEGCFAFKEHGGFYGTAGVPDIICSYKGRFIAFEVKTEKGRATELQEATIKKINKAGGTALIVRSVQDVKDAIRNLGVRE